jgi:hypothetical protein
VLLFSSLGSGTRTLHFNVAIVFCSPCRTSRELLQGSASESKKVVLVMSMNAGLYLYVRLGRRSDDDP